MVCADLTDREVDQLRKSMATFKFTGGMSKFKTKLFRNGQSAHDERLEGLLRADHVNGRSLPLA
ncbi:hypothetical protein [Rhizobium sp. BR 362]|uniref:hypothetical protein n=1 Tax=Rhizobium sp. BR 362 TaxID=3040670 RepID=UPI002F3FBF14